jgi:hypothetical protein
MAEVQKTDAVHAGELTQRFIQFVIMQSQQILYVLGGLDTEGESIPPNFEAAQILIDQLGMIQEKTRGNLSAQENALLEDALTRVRFAFVQTSSGGSAASAPNPAAARDPVPPTATPSPSPSAPASKTPPDDDHEGKKKFTKTYG